jgi:hypothetical protein
LFSCQVAKAHNDEGYSGHPTSVLESHANINDVIDEKLEEINNFCA